MQRRLGRGGVGEALQIADPGRGVGVAGPDQRVEQRQHRRRLRRRDLLRRHLPGRPLRLGRVGEPAESGRQRPPGPGRRRLDGRSPGVRRTRVAARVQGVEDAAGMRRADALVQPEQPEPGQLVGRIDEDPGRGEEVLDVSGVGEPQPAELHVRDLPRAQLDLQHVAVMSGADQHRLVAQRGAVLVRLEHPGADLPRLGGLVVAADEQRGHPRTAVAGQRQVQALLAPGGTKP